MKIILALGLLLLAAAAVITQSGRRYDAREHEPFQAALGSVQQLDAAIREDVARVRDAHLAAYDDFESRRLALTRALTQLDRIPGCVQPDARQQLQELRTHYQDLARTRQERMEHLKSTHAIVANSRRYLPVALGELEQGLGERAADRALARELARLGARLLQLEVDHDTALPDEAAAGLQHWLTQYPMHPQAAFVRHTARHVELMTTSSRDVQRLTREILALPTASVSKQMLELYEAELDASLRQAQGFRWILAALCAALLLLAGYALLALRRARQLLEHTVEARTRALRSSEQRFRTLAECAPVGIFLTDAEGVGLYTNPRWLEITGLDLAGSLHGGWRRLLDPVEGASFHAEWMNHIREARPYDGELRLRSGDGDARVLHLRAAPVRDEGGALLGFVGTVEDVGELRRIAEERRRSSRLETMGRLGAGIAHELSTPLQYASDSCHFLRDGVGDLQGLIVHYREALSNDSGERTQRLAEAERAADLDHLLTHLPRALDRTQEGLERALTILRAVKAFAVQDGRHYRSVDINLLVQQALTVTRNEYKYVAELQAELSPLPTVACRPGAVGQAVVQLLLHAAASVSALVAGTAEKGRIRVRTRSDDTQVCIEVEDSGSGIPEPLRARLAAIDASSVAAVELAHHALVIARSIAVDQHGGALDVLNHPGEGTTVRLRLPLQVQVPA